MFSSFFFCFFLFDAAFCILLYISFYNMIFLHLTL